MTTPSHTPEQTSAWTWPIVLAAAVLAVLLRVELLTGFNVSLVGALALFAGARLRNYWAWVIPVIVMLVSDLLLWRVRADPPFSWYVYTSFLISVALGRYLVGSRGWAWIVGGGLAASAQFFLVTNFFCWLDPQMLYPQTPQGLVACYVAAIPFAQGTFLGDLLFVPVLFGCQALLAHYVPARTLAGEEQS